MSNDSEEVPIEMVIEIFAMWDQIYPDRLSPGEICEIGHYLHDKSKVEFIDYKKNPELAPKKYYSDGVPIDWNNIFISNLEYHKRVEEHEYNLPGIEQIVPIYFHLKKN